MRAPYGLQPDGTARCINSEPGTFNHECGKPALWIGQTLDGREACFCEDCRWNGHESLDKVRWWEVPPPQQLEAEERDPYAGDTADVGDEVTWTDPTDQRAFEELTVVRVWPKQRELTVRGHFGRSGWEDRNNRGEPILRTRRLPMDQITVSRRSM